MSNHFTAGKSGKHYSQDRKETIRNRRTTLQSTYINIPLDYEQNQKKQRYILFAFERYLCLYAQLQAIEPKHQNHGSK